MVFEVELQDKQIVATTFRGTTSMAEDIPGEGCILETRVVRPVANIFRGQELEMLVWIRNTTLDNMRPAPDYPILAFLEVPQ